jgi:hypothetical protein
VASAPTYAKQVAGSLLAAALIVAIVIAAVTMAIGPGLDATELRERQELQEERYEQQEERRDDAAG